MLNLAMSIYADGNPLPTTTANDRAELNKAVIRYKSNLDNAEARVRQARNALNDARSRTQKMQALAKQAQKAVAVATSLLKKKKATAASTGRGRTRLTEAEASLELQKG